MGSLPCRRRAALKPELGPALQGLRKQLSLTTFPGPVEPGVSACTLCAHCGELAEALPGSALGTCVLCRRARQLRSCVPVCAADGAVRSGARGQGVAMAAARAERWGRLVQALGRAARRHTGVFYKLSGARSTHGRSSCAGRRPKACGARCQSARTCGPGLRLSGARRRSLSGTAAWCT